VFAGLLLAAALVVPVVGFMAALIVSAWGAAAVRMTLIDQPASATAVEGRDGRRIV